MTYLDSILARKRLEVATFADLEPSPVAASPRRSLTAALRARRGVIAEIKRASPSQGPLRPDLDVVQTARAYEAAGAVAISVLTDGPGFQGSFDDLAAARAAVMLPLLDKDFIVDPRQVQRAHRSGADAILLIVAALDDAALAELMAAATALSLEALVEIHDEAELERALSAGASLVGINNRNLRSFAVDPGTSERLLPRLPSGVVGVSESGIGDAQAAARLFAAGARALLIGEALVRADDPTTLLREIGKMINEKGSDR
jgi:indole-3-glycerol phosphate synthase